MLTMIIRTCLSLLVYIGYATYGESRWWSTALPKQESISIAQVRKWAARNKPAFTDHTFATIATKPGFLAGQVGWTGSFDMFRKQYYSLGPAAENVALFLEVPGAYSLIEFKNGDFRVSGSKNLFDLPGGQGRILAVNALTHTAFVRVPVMIEIEKGCSLLGLVQQHLHDDELQLEATPDGWFPGAVSLAIHSFWLRREIPPSTDVWEHRKSIWCQGRSKSCDCKLVSFK